MHNFRRARFARAPDILSTGRLRQPPSAGRAPEKMTWSELTPGLQTGRTAESEVRADEERPHRCQMR
eukprot:2096641-Prymnesium_polylepis.1